MAPEDLIKMLALVLVYWNSGLFFHETDSPESSQQIEQLKLLMPHYCFYDLKSIEVNSGLEELGKMKKISIIDTTGSSELSERIIRSLTLDNITINLIRIIPSCTNLYTLRTGNKIAIKSKKARKSRPFLYYLCISNSSYIEYLPYSSDKTERLDFDIEARTKCEKTNFRIGDLDTFTEHLQDNLPDPVCRKACGNNRTSSFGNTTFSNFIANCSHCNFCTVCEEPKVSSDCLGGCQIESPDATQTKLEEIPVLILIVLMAIVIAIVIFMLVIPRTSCKEFESIQLIATGLLTIVTHGYWAVFFKIVRDSTRSQEEECYLCLAGIFIDHLFWIWPLVVCVGKSMSKLKRFAWLFGPAIVALIAHGIVTYAFEDTLDRTVCFTDKVKLTMFIILLAVGIIVGFVYCSEINCLELAGKIVAIFLYIFFEADKKSANKSQTYLNGIYTKAGLYIWDVVVKHVEASKVIDCMPRLISWARLRTRRASQAPITTPPISTTPIATAPIVARPTEQEAVATAAASPSSVTETSV